MGLNAYPTEERNFFNRHNHPEKMEQLKRDLNSHVDGKLFKAKIRFTISPKCLIPLLTVKNDPDPKGLEKTGYFSSVAIQQAVKHGFCSVAEVLFAIESSDKAFIYDNFINVFKTKRDQNKRSRDQRRLFLGLKEDEPKLKEDAVYARFDVLQELCKLIPNSSYGSLLMRKFEYAYVAMSIATFERNHDPTLEIVSKCGHNQILVKYLALNRHDNNHAIDQGVFILDYSKIPLNDALAALKAFTIAGIVLYCDTDSIYILVRNLPILEKAGLIGPNLGQAKNDYGSRLIDKFRSLGKKMKFCLLSDDEIKSTLKGYKGLSSLSKEEKIEIFKAFDDVISTGNTEVFLTRNYESMRRNAFCISSRIEHRSFRMTAHDQYQVVNNICYPLYYDMKTVSS